MQSDRTHSLAGGNINNRVNVIKINNLHMNIESPAHDTMHIACTCMRSDMQHVCLIMSHNATGVSCMQNPTKRLGEIITGVRELRIVMGDG